jgi:surface antigen/peptidoglycan hydrolase CwlO-like protein
MLRYSLANTKTSHKRYMKKNNKRLIAVAAIFGLIGLGAAVTTHSVFADQYQDQINSLNSDSSVKQGSLNQLGFQASSLQDAISKLQTQIDGLQSQITANETARDQTVAKISKAEADITQQRSYLSDSLKAMYVDGGITSLEMLASSQDINHFVDQEQYQNSVQGQIQRTLDTIKQLRVQLDNDKATLERMIADLSAMRTTVTAQQAEQARILSLNQSQQDELDSQIKANGAKVTELQHLQALENARLSGGSPGVGANCGGGYPGKTTNSRGGTWGCNYDLDQGMDNWGMYNRECVSYTAFRVASSGRYMPAWGSLGIGNANQWDDNARAAGIPVDGNPRKGDVAVSNSGSFGHVMYVEQVASDGSIYVSDYNQQYDGRYREYWITAATVSSRALVFVHF